MRIFAIDDEPKMLTLLHDAIAEAEPEAEIVDFCRVSSLLNAVENQGLTPDVVFADVELPGMNGLAMAVRIKCAAPEAKIIFVTAFPQYAARAYRLHANGYIIKPVDAQRVREELDLLSLPRQEKPSGKLCVRCFGYFEVLWQGEPLIFARTKTKELLAYLVDREGAACTRGEIISALWENQDDDQAAKRHIRVLINDLRCTLRRIDMEEVLIRAHRQLAVRCDLLDCDYYRLRNGEPDAINDFRGQYMQQYSWAELTAARLYFQGR